MGVRDCLKLDWLLIEPLLCELLHGWGLEGRVRQDDESVVNISLQKHVVDVF